MPPEKINQVRLGYTLRFTLSDMVGSLLHLVEDPTPTPMMNRKPIEKNPTAFDKFDDQQTEYDSRVKTKDRVKQVNEHNSGYPKLRDELDRRHSISRITVINKKEKETKTRHRSNSRQLKNPRRKEKKTKRRELKPRINKNKNNKKEKSKYRSAFMHARAKPEDICEYCGCRIMEKELRINDTSNPVSSSSVPRNKSHHTKDTMSNMSQKYPDSREPSMSSYHSFFSSDHEPME